MANPPNLTLRWTRLQNRLAARRAVLGRPATAFRSQPEPRSIGSFARGRQLVAGNFLFAGHLVQAPDTNMWDLSPADRSFAEALHGFGWLDDLAAAGDGPARACAQAWLWGWIERFGRGRGPGWTPDLTGRRLMRWISHAFFLLSGQESEASQAFYRSLAAQTNFLGRRWKASAPGLPRFEALTGLIYASISLDGMERHLSPALAALDRECRSQIDTQGGLPTRKPRGTAGCLQPADLGGGGNWASPGVAPAKPTGRQSSGSHRRCAPFATPMAGWHGFTAAVAGLRGGLTTRWPTAGSSGAHRAGLAMGFARLSAGRTSIVIDTAPPPQGPCLGRCARLDPGVRADLGPQATDRQLRLGREFRRRLAPRRAGHAIAFHPGVGGEIQREAGPCARRA